MIGVPKPHVWGKQVGTEGLFEFSLVHEFFLLHWLDGHLPGRPVQADPGPIGNGKGDDVLKLDLLGGRRVGSRGSLGDDLAGLAAAALDALTDEAYGLRVTPVGDAPQPAPDRPGQVIQLFLEKADLRLARGGRGWSAEPCPEGGQVLGAGLQFGSPRLRQMVDAPLGALFAAHLAQVFQILHGRVDRAGAGGVFAARPFFQGLDDLVAVLRAVAERVQEHVPRFPAPGAAPVPAEWATASSFGASPLGVSAPAAPAAVAAALFLAVVIRIMVEVGAAAEMAGLVAVSPGVVFRVVPVPGLVCMSVCVVFQESVSFIGKTVFVVES